jgi:hypothetical protein
MHNNQIFIEYDSNVYTVCYAATGPSVAHRAPLALTFRLIVNYPDLTPNCTVSTGSQYPRC